MMPKNVGTMFLARFIEANCSQKATQLFSVPVVSAGAPRQLRREGCKEVEEDPGQNDYVINIEKGHDHYRAVADACGKNGTAKNE